MYIDSRIRLFNSYYATYINNISSLSSMFAMSSCILTHVFGYCMAITTYTLTIYQVCRQCLLCHYVY